MRDSRRSSNPPGKAPSLLIPSGVDIRFLLGTGVEATATVQRVRGADRGASVRRLLAGNPHVSEGSNREVTDSSLVRIGPTAGTGGKRHAPEQSGGRLPGAAPCPDRED